MTSDLITAAQEGELAEVERLLVAKANPSARDNLGWTPLHWASKYGHELVVAALLTAKADPDARNIDGRTPLQIASSNGHEAVVATLLSANADPNTKDDNSMTPLHDASMKGHEAVVAALLAGKADPNTKDNSDHTPLHWASMKGHEAVAAALLSAKADPNAKDKIEWKPLRLAKENGHEVVAMLLRDDFVHQIADQIPDPDVSRRIRNFTAGHELNTPLRNLYVAARKSMGLSNEQKKQPFPPGLGEALLATFMRSVDDYHRASSAEERRRHAVTACAGGTFPELLDACVRSDAPSRGRKETDEALSYLTPYWQQQYQHTIQIAESTLARTSPLPEGVGSALSGLLSRRR